MAFKQTLKVTQQPRIAQKELFTADTSSGSGQNPFYKSPKGAMGVESSAGSKSPYVMINGAQVTDIDMLIVYETEILPKIKIMFKDSLGALSGPNYPRNNPILSLYIKVSGNALKPIRMDFLITNIKSDQDPILDKESMGNSAEFIMTGELFIPKIYNNLSKAYRSVGSKEALKKLAADLDLGFSENDSGTNDTMTWINPNRNGIYLIDHISRHSYLDEDTFFDCFIDKYFNLTFVNVPMQLENSKDLDVVPEQRIDPSELELTREIQDKGSDKGTADALSVLQLTNNQRFQGRPEYIRSHSLLGDVGSVLKTKGYKKQIYYYDHLLGDGEKFTKFYIKPVEINGFNDSLSLVPSDESLKSSVVKKWINVDYGNNHREWNAASLINDHNKSELQKVKLKVETAGINLQVLRGSSIKVNMFNFTEDLLSRNSQIDEKPTELPDTSGLLEKAAQIPDVILTGTYYVSGIRYVYDRDSGFSTEFDLCRMNWIGENIID